MTAYRIGEMAGFFIPQKHADAIAELIGDEQETRQEVNMPRLRFHTLEGVSKSTIAIDEPLSSLPSNEDQMEWLKDTAIRLVNALRPRLGEN